MSKFTVLLITVISTMNLISAQEKDDAAARDSPVAPGAKVTLLAGGFRFTEGPAVDRDGNVYFTDQPNNRILKWSADDEKLSVFDDNTGRANGLYFDRENRLLSCSDMDNEIWEFDMKGGHRVTVAGFEGRKLNGPNDLWIHPGGGIYFTDPLYRRDYWTRTPEMQQDGEHVYYLSPDYGKLIRVATDLEKPNGIIGSPDGRLLYVADIKAGKTYVYEIQPDATLANKKLFAPMGSDGMTTDRDGNIYLTGKGVTVFDPAGRQIAHIPVEAGWTANVCFGGKDMKTLFITATEYFYSLRMNVAGVR
ncbi:MAG: SMP-30/gluconolactonase/LRE family protein [Tannerella sp.]|jgi:gluconolactonase|nr:SMP-30/gluconolactonase/LRE family protein [Tannerella sp.]